MSEKLNEEILKLPWSIDEIVRRCEAYDEILDALEAFYLSENHNTERQAFDVLQKHVRLRDGKRS